ncbi:ABC transporter ATP-binding protein [Paenibacillus pabuli]|uniref:ABC transporter ATP-binding protein n=1 Tax=Paenibacillus pabuli TaxID=1472 RepID=UPI001FFFC83D|nr:dipeptide ABC transporter ATP-binding protein [Paenibacillus pabuli]UPK46678.1 dipeptide ABC transporter ATP-binding protein [Paenibacillus pabuli]
MNSKSLVESKPLLQVSNLNKHFPVRSSFGRTKGQVKAVNGVSFDIHTGQTFGLVGESGCGKSTLGRSILRLVEPTSGEAFYEGTDILGLSKKELRSYRQHMQMVFQDPYTSLDPRKRVGYSIEEPLLIHKKGNKRDRTETAMSLLRKVGFSEEHYERFPHEFSGGQRQRLGIAKALALGPKLIICDEPVSALDVSIQSQVINLLEEVQEELGISYLFIAHDLSVVRHIADRIGVMYLGEMVEQGPAEVLFADPLHPYTKSLLSAVPVPNPRAKRERVVLSGEIPSPLHPPAGCVFHTRCPYVMETCRQVAPQKRFVAPDREVQCHLYDE